MSLIKTPQEIDKLRQGGKILSEVLSELMRACVAGAHTEGLDEMARKLIKDRGGVPSFLDYQIHHSDPPYPSSLCISINEEVVHGLSSPDRVIKDGDLVKLDIGMWYEDMATDMAATVCVGNCPEAAIELSRETRHSLELALETVKAGAWIHDIGKTIQNYLEPKGYGIVRDLVGHGVGHAVHEDPPIPNFHDRRIPAVKLKTGMVLAIEPMVSLGDWRIKQKNDGWTIVTVDKSLAAHWEVTIAVTDTGYELLTPWPLTNLE